MVFGEFFLGLGGGRGYGMERRKNVEGGMGMGMEWHGHGHGEGITREAMGRVEDGSDCGFVANLFEVDYRSISASRTAQTSAPKNSTKWPA